ncbi:MAG: hydroxymethylbilane synthase, partial [Bdellovibrionales bacterium]
MLDKTLRIGTRGSKMALTQAKLVRSKLQEKYPDLATEIVVIETSGDWKPEHGEKPLAESDGGKGLFAKEIEIALLDEQIDIGVHSVKDMPSFLPEGLSMLHYLERDNAYDALVSEKYASFEDLPKGATVGSTSVRRKSYLLHMRPDLNVVNIRGNVTTRIEKMLDGQVDALILSASGL